MRRLVEVEQLAPHYRRLSFGSATLRPSREALAVLSMLDTAPFKAHVGPTALLLSLWRRGFVARRYRDAGGTPPRYVHAGWCITTRGRACVREAGRTGRP